MMDIPQEVILPDELIAEILSYLSVKTLMRMRSVSKAWKTLISNSTFVNLHLQRSPQNAHVTLFWDNGHSSRLSFFPVRRLLENPWVFIEDDAYCCGVYLHLCDNFVGSSNGLVCFYGSNMWDNHSNYRFQFCNLAMGTKSESLGYFVDSENAYSSCFKFSFGFDNSTGTYKVVAFRVDGHENDETSWRSLVKVFNLGNNSSWRKIQSFPVTPLSCLEVSFGNSQPNDGVHFSGTVNWLAFSNTFRSSYYWKHVNVENFVILSLSLSTETYTQLSLPKGFNEVPRVQPTLLVLRNCLCFSHDFRGTEFVIWQMREFGVRESWTQLIKVSYQTLQMKNLSMDDDYIYDIQLLPLYLSENSDTLIFANNTNNENDQEAYLANNEEGDNAIIYNWKDGRVERTRFSKDIFWFCTGDYVESLVPIT